jgi:hypothetical protein
MNRFAYSIFCDDIRAEVNNKTSFMGVFGHLMYLPTFPATLPKLCIAITVSTPIDQPFKSLSFRGDIGANLVFEMALDDEGIAQANRSEGSIEEPCGRYAQAIFVLSPFHIVEPGKLKITVLVDGAEIDCASLQISAAPDGLTIM